MRAYEFITEAEWDPSGWGNTPYGTDIDYFGIRVKMRPSTFLKLAAPLDRTQMNPDVKKHMAGGGKIAYPMLEVKIPEGWEDGDLHDYATVASHEGRNRVTNWIEMHGDDPIQVNIIGRGGMRRRHFTPEIIERLSQGMHGERGRMFVRGPLFDVDTVLEEGNQGVKEDTSKLNYIGNCTDDDVIEHLFGDATGFAQAVDEYGDDFELDDLVVKYDPDSDIHSFFYKQQGVAEDNVSASGSDYAIHLGNLKRFFKAEDPLEELVPERGTHYYALHSDIFKDEQAAIPWRRTFASLTGKDFKEVLHNPKILGGYRPKKFPIPPGTLVGDMHLANLYYSKVFAKTPEEKQEIARQYKESLVPLEVADLSKYKKPELLIPKGQSVAESVTVTRIDSKPIKDFTSDLKAYKHTDDWSQSGLDTGDDSYWKNKNLKTSTTKGLFAGDPRRTALYATGNAYETRYVEFTQNGQPIVYFDKKDLPAMRRRKTYLSVFDASKFKHLPTGEWFSENPGKPIKQVPIGDPFKYIADQGWIVRVTDDLDKVFKQVKKMHKAGKISQYGAEGMNESKQGMTESTKNVTPTGYTWSFEHGGEVPYKSDIEVNTFIRVQDSRGKTVLGVWADVYRDNIEIQYSEVFDKKLRGKGIYTDFLKGLAKHYNIISDQDQNNAARNIYKKLGADYNSKSERHTLRKSSQGVAEDTNTVLDTDYFMNEGCGIYAVALALNEPGSQIYIISNKNGESWSKSFPYEITHVFVNVPNKGQYDVRGKRSHETMANDLSLGKGDYSVKGPFDPKEFFTKFMGSSDTKPLYGTVKDVKQLQSQIKDTLDEMALKSYTPLGKFNKPGPFKDPDYKLVVHPKHIEKVTTFFERVPQDFRMFMSNLPGKTKYRESGEKTPEEIKQIFGDKIAAEILKDTDDTITIIYMGNYGLNRQIMNSWQIAHRVGHAITATGRYNRDKEIIEWKALDQYFFNQLDNMLQRYYGVETRGWSPEHRQQLNKQREALIYQLGVQRSSRERNLNNTYEFLYEMLALYIKTGSVRLNPLPEYAGYGRQVGWKKEHKSFERYLRLRPEYRDEGFRQRVTDELARELTSMFNGILDACVGKVFVM